MSNYEINDKAVKGRRVDTLSKHSCQNNLLQSSLTSTNYETTMRSVPSIIDVDDKLCNIKKSVSSIDEYNRSIDENKSKCQKD